MCDNEYVAHAIVRERLREAEARGAFNAMLRQALASPRPSSADTAGEPRRPMWLDVWWQASANWVVHLALPKIWNRL